MGIFSEYAPRYWAAGLPVIPVNGKRPFFQQWQQFCERMPSPEEQASWVQDYPDQNIGLPLGPASGVCAIDIDTDDSTEIEAILNVLPEVHYRRVGKKGMVLLYKWNGSKGFKIRTRSGEQPVEFLSKGNQVILPPSIHPDTRSPYTANAELWEVLADLSELPNGFDRAALEDALGLNRTNARVDRSGIQIGGRHNALISYAARLRNQGYVDGTLVDHVHRFNGSFDDPLPEAEVDGIATWSNCLEGRSDFVRGIKDQIVRNSRANILLALRELGITLGHDAFSDQCLVEGLPGFNGFLDDEAVRRLWFQIPEHFGFQPAKDFFWEAVQDIARQNSFDPVCEQLARLEGQWDGERRIDSWLVRYAEAVDTPYVRAVGALMLIALARRARRPGVKFDTMPVLCGPQGGGKSSACGILAGNSQWFSDYLPFAADGREVIEALSGHWLVEAGELYGLRKAGAEKLKSFLSRTADHSRAAYARTTKAVPRRCIFIGTTNSNTFLTDGTGNRRFLPVTVGKFDLVALANDRDQLIAEAAVREAAGESIVLPPELWQVAERVQDAYRVENPIVSVLEQALDGWSGRIKSTDIWKLLGIPEGSQRLSLAQAVGNAMQELGWTSNKYRFGGTNPERGYQKGEGESATRRLEVVGLSVVPMEWPRLRIVA